MTRTDRRRAAIPAEEYAARYVDVPRFLACCRACPHFGANWSCPPLAAEPPAVWSRYRYLEITGLAVYPGGQAGDPAAFLAPYQARLLDELMARERRVPGSLCLAPGRCSRCRSCARAQGAPCRFPHLLRPSLEALGADVGQTAKDLLGLPLLWARDGMFPEYFLLVGGLLLPDGPPPERAGL